MDTKPKTGATTPPEQDPDAHVMARHLQVSLRLLLVLAAAVTVALMAFDRSLALLPAIAVPVLGVLLVIVNHLEREARATVLRRPGQAIPDEREVEVDARDAAISVALKLAGVLALGSVVVAAAFFDLATLGVAAALTLLFALFYGLPYWPLFIAEAAREEREKVIKGIEQQSRLKKVDDTPPRRDTRNQSSTAPP